MLFTGTVSPKSYARITLMITQPYRSSSLLTSTTPTGVTWDRRVRLIMGLFRVGMDRPLKGTKQTNAKSNKLAKVVMFAKRSVAVRQPLALAA